MLPALSALVEAGILPQAVADTIERSMSLDAARLHAEGVLIDSFRNGLSLQQRRALDLLDDTQGQPTARQLSLFWNGENDLLWASVQEDLVSVALENAVRASVSFGDDSMWQLVNEEVLTWTNDYFLSPDEVDFGSIPNLNITARTQFARVFEDWQRGELEIAGYTDGLPNLIRALEPTFGLVRAEAIGTTETTRLFSQSELFAGNANPFIAGWIYSTANDSYVSELCRSGEGAIMLKGESVFSDGKGPPPRHVRCRSSISQITRPALEALRRDGLVRERV